MVRLSLATPQRSSQSRVATATESDAWLERHTIFCRVPRLYAPPEGCVYGRCQESGVCLCAVRVEGAVEEAYLLGCLCGRIDTLRLLEQRLLCVASDRARNVQLGP